MKSERCALNGPWTNPDLQNLQKVLAAGGFRPVEQVNDMAAALYRTGVWEDEALVIRIVCFGRRLNRAVHRAFPQVPQFTWGEDVLPFIYRRFDEYKLEKQMHQQWDEDARELFAAAGQSPGTDGAGFIEAVEVIAPD